MQITYYHFVMLTSHKSKQKCTVFFFQFFYSSFFTFFLVNYLQVHFMHENHFPFGISLLLNLVPSNQCTKDYNKTFCFLNIIIAKSFECTLRLLIMFNPDSYFFEKSHKTLHLKQATEKTFTTGE